MDFISHILWANLLVPGDWRLIALGSIDPDVFTGINWAHRLSTGHGTFWKNRADFVGLVLGTEEYSWGGAEVNRGFLFKAELLANSIFGIALVCLLFPREFVLAYGLHVMVDAFTHKDAEIWRPFYPLSNFRFPISLVRWRLEPVWLVVLNFFLLAVLFLLTLIN